MAQANDVQGLATRTLAALDASHDYYTYTKRVWRLVGEVIDEGRKLDFRNTATSSRVDERSLMERVQLYLTDYAFPSGTTARAGRRSGR